MDSTRHAHIAERGVTFDAGIGDMPWARAASFAAPHGIVLVRQTPTAGT